MDLAFINAYTKFYQNSSICSEDIEEKHIFTSIKGHKCWKWLENIVQSSKSTSCQFNAYTKFDQNPQINSPVIEHKQNSDVDQGP